MGERAEQAEAEVREGLDAPSPAAVSIALGRASRKPGSNPVDAEAVAFLRKQSRLIDLQTEHLHEQRGLMLSRLRWGRFSDRLKALLQMLTVLVGLVIAVAIGAVAWGAWRDHAVVIDAFSVPPDLVQQGATGGALATELHDRLSALREETVTPAQGLDVREKAVSEARVEIPEMGVSLGEVSRLLHEWLGHERHISGEVTHVTAGAEKGALALNVRADGEPGVRLVQPDGDLEALLQKAAEHVYGAVDPWDFDLWLNERGRNPEALAFARAMTTRGDRSDRAFGYFAQDWFQPGELPLEQSRELLAKSVALDPEFGLNNLGVRDSNLGHAELALKEYRAAAERAAKAPPAHVTPEAIREERLLASANIGFLLGDLGPGLEYSCVLYQVSPCEERAVAAAAASGGAVSRIDPAIEARAFQLASALAQLHDGRAAQQILDRPSPNAQVQVTIDRLNATAALHDGREDWAALRDDLRNLQSFGETHPGFLRPAYKARTALALAHLGEAARAREIAAALPADCYPCLIARGQMAELLGERAEADRWFAEAARQGRSLPRAEEAWGRVTLARGDAKRALGLAEAAHRKSANFADAAELMGEALMAGRDYRAATRQFEQAAKLTPYWGRLHLRWGQALMLQGRYREARAQYETADGLDLTRPERAALNVLLARTASGPLHG